jgi:hypothetical protein
MYNYHRYVFLRPYVTIGIRRLNSVNSSIIYILIYILIFI